MLPAFNHYVAWSVKEINSISSQYMNYVYMKSIDLSQGVEVGSGRPTLPLRLTTWYVIEIYHLVPSPHSHTSLKCWSLQINNNACG